MRKQEIMMPKKINQKKKNERKEIRMKGKTKTEIIRKLIEKSKNKKVANEGYKEQWGRNESQTNKI